MPLLIGKASSVDTFVQLLTTVSTCAPTVRATYQTVPVPDALGLNPTRHEASIIVAGSSTFTDTTSVVSDVPGGADASCPCTIGLTPAGDRSTPAGGLCGTTANTLNGDSSTCWN